MPFSTCDDNMTTHKPVKGLGLGVERAMLLEEKKVGRNIYLQYWNQEGIRTFLKVHWKIYTRDNPRNMSIRKDCDACMLQTDSQ